MEADKRKKISDFMWWLIIVSIIAWVISTCPMLIFGLAIILGIWYYCGLSPQKSADTNEKKEVVEEMEVNSTTAEEKTENFSNKSNNFYSGISEGTKFSE